MAREIATWDPNALGAHLELQESDLIVTHSADADSIARRVQSTLGQAEGVHYVEVVAWGVGGVLADHVSIGVSESSEALDHYVGQTTSSVGFRVGEAAIYSGGGVAVDVTQAVAKAQPFGLLVDLDAAPPTMTVYVAGTPAGVIELSTGRTWYISASVGGDAAYDLSVFCNFGQRAFEFAVPVGARGGWYVDTDQPALLRASTLDFVSTPTDSPPNTPWPQLLDDDAEAYLERGMNVWPWGGSPVVRQGFGTVQLANDGSLDDMVGESHRDTYLAIRTVDRGGAYVDSTVAATAVIDRCESKVDVAIRIALRDTLSLLEKPLRRRYFLPSVPVAAAANTPLPLVLGAVRNVSGVLVNEVDARFVFADAQISTIAYVRDQADPLDPGASPPDFATTDDLTGIELHTLPVGKLTADLSVAGDIEVDPGVDDALGGAGDFTDTTWSDDVDIGVNSVNGQHTVIDLPGGWEVAPSRGHIVGNVDYTNDDGDVFGWGYVDAAASGGGVRRLAYGGRDVLWLGAVDTLSSPDSRQYWGIRTTSEVLTAGTTYKWELTVDWISVGVGSIALFCDDDGVTFLAKVNAVGSYSGYYTPTANKRVYLAAHRVTSSPTPAPAKSGLVSKLSFRDLSSGLSFDLPAISLAEYARQVLVERAELPSYAYSAVDLHQIDLDTGYPFGYARRDEVTVLEAIAAPLNSFCASAFPDRAGVIRFTRLVDPDSVEEPVFVFDLTEDDLLEPFDVVPDTAPGLTTRIGARRNWTKFSDSDFVADYGDVSAATREAFKRDYQVVRSSAVNLGPAYAHARLAKPLDSLHDDPVSAQAEIDRVCALYALGSNRRFFKPIRFAMPRDYSAQPGDLFRLRHPRFGLSGGKRLVIRTIRENFRKREITLQGWG